MRLWNSALLKACAKYPDMRIYDWASDVKDSWFIPDGIHFTTPGYAARAKLIANALRDAFVSPQSTDGGDAPAASWIQRMMRRIRPPRRFPQRPPARPRRARR